MTARPILTFLIAWLLAGRAALAQEGGVPPRAPGPDEHIAIGLALLEEGRRAEAIVEFDRALVLAPRPRSAAATRAAQALLAAGQAAAASGGMEEARNLLVPAMALDRSDPATVFLLVQVEYSLALRERDIGALDRVRGLLDELRRRDPRFGGAWFFDALLCLAVKDHEGAAEGFRGAVDRGFEVDEAASGLAQSLVALAVDRARDPSFAPDDLIRLLDEAEHILVVRKDERDLPEPVRARLRQVWLTCLVNLAAIHQRAGQVVRAEEILRRLVQLEPRNHLHWYNLGLLLGDLRRPEEAVAAYRKALSLNPDREWIEPYPMLGTLLSERGETAEAEKLLSEYVEREPDSWVGHLRYAGHLSRAGRPREAVREFERCVEIDPSVATGRAAMEELALELGKADRAAEAAAWMNLLLTVRTPPSRSR